MSHFIRCVLLASLGWAASAAPAGAQVLHAVLCVPTQYAAKRNPLENQYTNRAGEQIALRWNRILQRIPPQRRNVVMLLDDDYHKDRLLGEIRCLNPATNDAVFVYCVAHGSYNPVDRFVLSVGNDESPNSWLPRSALSAEIRKMNVRLGVLITESCAIHNRDSRTIEEVDRIVGKKARSMRAAPSESISALLDQLFM